jgi:hypothetical protein
MSKDREGPIQPDDLIRRLVPDPANPDVERLVGFRLGESDRSGYWRLYIDMDLSDYLEFRKDDVLDGKELPDGSTVVWQKAAEQFLSGDISERFLRATGFPALARAIGVGVATGTGTFVNNQCCCITARRGQGGSPA